MWETLHNVGALCHLFNNDDANDGGHDALITWVADHANDYDYSALITLITGHSLLWGTEYS